MIGRRSFLLVCVAAVVAFLLYASIFLCFFVDDEAIPLVYARNLLRGRGLMYTALEGRVEGYSDFLHVIWSAVLLGATSALGLSPFAPIAIGKGISALAGIGIVLVAARTMRDAGANLSGLAAGLGFLSVAGPLAVWSCSSLETAVFALMVMAFTRALFVGDGLRLHLATALGGAIVLERIDGFIYVGALIAAAAAAGAHRRRDLWTLAWRLALAAGLFHLWRYLYFGYLLTAPLAAKVLHQFAGPANAVVHEPEQHYLRTFLDLYGVAAVPVFVAAAVGAWRWAPGRAATAGVLALGAYVGAVGDWMFGWRFVVALLPLAALIVALAVTRVPGRFGWLAALVAVAWSSVAATAFVATYRDAKLWPVFWERPAGWKAWVHPYGDLIELGRTLIQPGERIAYNQAGIVPYVLDAENIDALGICSGFVAHLPTTDVHYTRVGRYSPLRNEPVLSTTHAYVLYNDVRFLLTRTNLLMAANSGRVPELLLDGHFRLVRTDASGHNAVYQRTEKSAAPYRRHPRLFTENLAHTSRLLEGTIEEDVLTPADFATRFAFLAEESAEFDFTSVMQMHLDFAAEDEDVSQMYIGGIKASAPSTIIVSLFGEAGRLVARKQVAIGPNVRRVLEAFDPGVRARGLSIRFTTAEGAARVTIADMRLLGQSAALRDYVRENLRFAAD